MEERMVELVYLGGSPQGDAYSTAAYEVHKGDKFSVPQAEADRLMADFPKCFKPADSEEDEDNEKGEEDNEERGPKEKATPKPKRKPR